MNPGIQSLEELYHQHKNEFIQNYFRFLSFPSISSEPQYAPAVRECAEWLKKAIEKIGFKCALWPTQGHPVLFGSWDGAGPDKPTLLIYNHYDVQPVDPLSEWTSPPFEPTVREGKVYARGAQDNKGQCMYVLQALKLLMERDGRLPLNIKLCIEGEEECGSHGLDKILDKYTKELKADYLAVVDLGILSATQPSLTLGFRGLVTMDMEVIGSSVDLHSGSHGGVVYNPIHALVELLSKLRDSTGKIAIPGFYDIINELPKDEQDQLHFDFDNKAYEESFGAKPTGGERALSPAQRNWLRPTVEINGIIGGYTGEGFKTVIPAKAKAKISCRLVPDQDPVEVGKHVAAFLEKSAPEGIIVKVNVHPGGGKPVHSQASSKAIQAFKTALEEVYEKPTSYTFSGASIPVITHLAEASQSEVALLGLGLDSDRIHAPDEHFSLDRLQKGCVMMARGIELLAGTQV